MTSVTQQHGWCGLHGNCTQRHADRQALADFLAYLLPDVEEGDPVDAPKRLVHIGSTAEGEDLFVADKEAYQPFLFELSMPVPLLSFFPYIHPWGQGHGACFAVLGHCLGWKQYENCGCDRGDVETMALNYLPWLAHLGRGDQRMSGTRDMFPLAQPICALVRDMYTRMRDLILVTHDATPGHDGVWRSNALRA